MSPPKMLVFWMLLLSKSHGKQFSQVERPELVQNGKKEYLNCSLLERISLILFKLEDLVIQLELLLRFR